jgi:flagellin FlaB
VIYTKKKIIIFNTTSAIGIGSIIIFIAMILVAGIAASVFMQSMDNLQQQAKKTSSETMRDISGGLNVLQITGYNSQGSITKLSIFTEIITASDPLDIYHAKIALSDSNQKIFLIYNESCFNNTVENGLFNSINFSNLKANEFGIVVIRDVDSSITSEKPIINNGDIIGLLINISSSLSGIDTNVHISGNIYPEFGLPGYIDFTTPSAYINSIIDLS